MLVEAAVFEIDGYTRPARQLLCRRCGYERFETSSQCSSGVYIHMHNNVGGRY